MSVGGRLARQAAQALPWGRSLASGALAGPPELVPAPSSLPEPPCRAASIGRAALPPPASSASRPDRTRAASSPVAARTSPRTVRARSIQPGEGAGTSPSGQGDDGCCAARLGFPLLADSLRRAAQPPSAPPRAAPAFGGAARPARTRAGARRTPDRAKVFLDLLARVVYLAVAIGGSRSRPGCRPCLCDLGASLGRADPFIGLSSLSPRFPGSLKRSKIEVLRGCPRTPEAVFERRAAPSPLPARSASAARSRCAQPWKTRNRTQRRICCGRSSIAARAAPPLAGENLPQRGAPSSWPSSGRAPGRRSTSASAESPFLNLLGGAVAGPSPYWRRLEPILLRLW